MVSSHDSTSQHFGSRVSTRTSKYMELFLQSDDEDEEDAEGALPTSVLDMAAKSSRAPAAAEQKKKNNKKNETNKPGQEDDFFGSFGM